MILVSKMKWQSDIKVELIQVFKCICSCWVSIPTYFIMHYTKIPFISLCDLFNIFWYGFPSQLSTGLQNHFYWKKLYVHFYKSRSHYFIFIKQHPCLARKCVSLQSYITIKKIICFHEFNDCKNNVL